LVRGPQDQRGLPPGPRPKRRRRLLHRPVDREGRSEVTASGWTAAPSSISDHRDRMRVSRTNTPCVVPGLISPFDSQTQKDEPSTRVTQAVPTVTGSSATAEFTLTPPILRHRQHRV
jgi:hypothetical protein